MTPFERSLTAAVGYLELGLPLEANEALDDIEARMRTLPLVLAVRLEVYAALEKWEPMEVIAQQLSHRQPDDPDWPISQAYATRRAYGLQRALGVLMNAVQRFPDCATIHFNLACYEAQLGNLDLARRRLKEAIRLDGDFREKALVDPDLVALQADSESE